MIRLFEMEIPEIYDGTIVVKNAVHEPGDRAKVAVASLDRDVDPVGACVGMKGSRINAIIRELRGEKIDIVQWSDDPAQYAANALNPAKISKVLIIDPSEKRMEVIVEEKQQSLAIGKKGQNVRLASKLIGWQIDVKSEEQKKQEVLSVMESLTSSSTSLGRAGRDQRADHRETAGSGDRKRRTDPGIGRRANSRRSPESAKRPRRKSWKPRKDLFRGGGDRGSGGNGTAYRHRSSGAQPPGQTDEVAPTAAADGTEVEAAEAEPVGAEAEEAPNPAEPKEGENGGVSGTKED